MRSGADRIGYLGAATAVAPLRSPHLQHAMGYDHAEKLETSLMPAVRSETVDYLVALTQA